MPEEERIQKNLKELELTFLSEGNDSLNYSTSENEDRLRQLRKNLFELLLKCDQCMSIWQWDCFALATVARVEDFHYTPSQVLQALQRFLQVVYLWYHSKLLSNKWKEPRWKISLLISAKPPRTFLLDLSEKGRTIVCEILGVESLRKKLPLEKLAKIMKFRGLYLPNFGSENFKPYSLFEKPSWNFPYNQLNSIKTKTFFLTVTSIQKQNSKN